MPVLIPFLGFPRFEIGNVIQTNNFVQWRKTEANVVWHSLVIWNWVNYCFYFKHLHGDGFFGITDKQKHSQLQGWPFNPNCIHGNGIPCPR